MCDLDEEVVRFFYNGRQICFPRLFYLSFISHQYFDIVELVLALNTHAILTAERYAIINESVTVSMSI